MQHIVKQISSLEKVRANDDLNHPEIYQKTLLAGERFSYQICIKSTEYKILKFSVESSLAKNIKLFRVKDAYMDTPITDDVGKEDYITWEPGPMPDILIPLEETNYQVAMNPRLCTIWIKIDVPQDTMPGKYSVKIKAVEKADDIFEKEITIDVIPAVMPAQKLIYTRWIYLDCIATAHGVDIYSESHWTLIDQYIAAAADMGINMILVPIHTPPLDTAIGTTRPCVQLVDITKKGEHYDFSFLKFHRFISICKKHGIKYFEMAHMFSQWGAKCAPNIMVTENGNTEYMFGWHIASNSIEYTTFLKQYLQAIATELEKAGIAENTYFHISDEPFRDEHIATYKAGSELIRPLIGNSKTLDALSNYVIYEKGYVECPVTHVAHIHEFLEHNIENQWVYYCSGPQEIFTNSLLAMPSYRIRILGFLLYKYNIKGFLHWGFNFYNARNSMYHINPYLTTSADRDFGSGDPFIVYPAANGVYTSIRGEIIYDAIQDMNICFALEQYIGRDDVILMIDNAAERNLRFDDYPRSNEFLEKLRRSMIAEIEKHI